MESGEEWYKLSNTSNLSSTKKFLISKLPDADITITKVVLSWTGAYSNNKSNYITNGTPKVNGTSIPSGT